MPAKRSRYAHSVAVITAAVLQLTGNFDAPVLQRAADELCEPLPQVGVSPEDEDVVIVSFPFSMVDLGPSVVVPAEELGQGAAAEPGAVPPQHVAEHGQVQLHAAVHDLAPVLLLDALRQFLGGGLVDDPLQAALAFLWEGEGGEG